MWGAATSAHQVEGNNRLNDWWAWEQAGKVTDLSGAACNHYQLFQEDFRMARSLGHTAHRFSLEWSRLEPREGEWDEAVFRHYEEVFDSLQKEGLEPVVTLHHFTNPLWFAEKGGWLQPTAPVQFGVYVRRVAERFGPRVRYWITINEPLIYIYKSFVEGVWPPGKKSMEEAFRVVRTLIHAHALAYQILHDSSRNNGCMVSIAHHMTAMTACRARSVLDRWSVFLRQQLVNRMLFRSLLSGYLFYPGVFFEKLPMKKTLDFLGVNYYARDFIRFQGFSDMNRFGVVCAKDHHLGEIAELNDLGWEVYPQGIYEALTSLRSFGLPILVTENGICTQDDSQRARFIADHLAQVNRAKSEGTPIFGYFYWSLVDNFEWAEGFRPRFGIVEVNYSTQKRKIRSSSQVLKKSCEAIFGEETCKVSSLV